MCTFKGGPVKAVIRRSFVERHNPTNLMQIYAFMTSHHWLRLVNF